MKSWAELIRDAEGGLKFVQDTLRIEVSDYEIEKRITALKASVLKSEALDLGGDLDGIAQEEKKARPKRASKSSNGPPPPPA